MSIHPYKSLIVSGKYYSENELLEFAKQQTSGNSIPSWEVNLYEFILEWLSDSQMFRVKTSGSTGAAKWIEVEKERMVKSAQVTGQFFNLQKNDKALMCLPVNFIAGKMMVVRTFVLGLNLIPVEPSGNPLKSLNELCDFAAMTPMQVYNTLTMEDGYQKLNQIRNLIIGGGDISQPILNRIRVLGNNIYNTYGMTETLTHVALKKLTGRKPDSFFKALPGVKFEQDERDCLVIITSHLAEKKIVTNDIVELKDDKTFNFIGRYDHVINSGGIKIFPEVIEQKLQPFINERFIVAGVPDDQLGQRVILVIEGKNEPNIDFENLFTKNNLSKYETPKQVYFFDSFPETESGKIIRQQVSQMIL